MTPKRTLLLIAAFVAVTFGSFVMYILREVSGSAALPPLLEMGGLA